MSDRSLPRELKRWALEEFNLPKQNLPPDSYFKTLCLGQGVSIWKYVTQHVYNQRNVRVMCGNLQWYKMLQDNEVHCALGQSEAASRQGLLNEIRELRVELNQLDAQIARAETQLAAEEQSVCRSWEADTETRRRELLLRALSQRCLYNRQTLHQDGRRVSKHCQALGQLSRKAEVELVFGEEAVDSSGNSLGPAAPEPQVLCKVRELCEERLLFFQSLQECELKRVQSSPSDIPREQKAAVFHHWLSAVEDLFRAHPPSHVLHALQYLACGQQGSLQEKLSSLDVDQEVAALGFHYDCNHLQDLSKDKRELPSVKSLLQSGWEEVEQSLMQLAQIQSRVRLLETQLDGHNQAAELELGGSKSQIETLTRSVFNLELQCVMQSATMDSMLDQCDQLGKLAKEKQEGLRNLCNQWQRIMDFRELVDNKQEQIRGLIKGNSTAKTELSRVHTEVDQFVKAKLLPQCWGLTEAVKTLRNAVSQEVRLAGGVSLVALDRRIIEGVRRVPSEWLSIHRLQSPIVHNLCENMAFPMYRAPEELCAQALSQKLELRFLHRLLQLHTVSLTSLQNQRRQLSAPDLQALLQQVCEADQELLCSLLPRVQELSQQSSQALSYAAKAKTTVLHWWEQPAQFALPEMSNGGLTLLDWIQRWRVAAKAIE